MKLSDLDPKQVSLVKKGEQAQSDAPLRLSDLQSDQIQLVKRADKSAEKDGPREGETAIRQAASGFTAGFDDEIIGAIGAAGRVAGVKNLGSWQPFNPDSKLEMTDEPLSREAFAQAYRENRDATRGQQAEDMATNPKTAFTANLVGAIASPAGKLKAAEAIKGAGLAAKTLQASKTAAMQGTLFGAGMSDADLTKGDVGQFAKDVGKSAAIGGAIPAGVVTARGAVKAGKSTVLGLLNVSEKNAGEYLARRAEVNAAPKLVDIMDGVDGAVKKLSDAVESGKLGVADAKAALAEMKMTVRNQLTDAKVDAREAARRAEDMFKESAAKLIQPLKDIKAPTSRAADAAGMVGDLKKVVRQGSSKAYETLDEANARVDLSGVYKQIYSTIDKLKASGTDEALAIAKKLDAYKERLMLENWGSVDASAAKTLIQGLDEITEYSPMAGAFDKASNKAFKGVRYALDDTLKETIPAYRAQMSEIAPQSDLLRRANKSFGTPEAAVGKLGGLNTPRGEFDRKILADLENTLGRPGEITSEAAKFAQAQATLKNPQVLEKMRRSLPEYSDYRGAMAKLAKMNPKWTREQLESAMARSKEGRALSMAESELAKAKAAYEPISRLAPGSTESKLASFGKPSGPMIKDERALEALDKMSGTNFTRQIKDRAILDSFSKGNTNGARNTLVGTVIGAALGGLPGAATGGAIGHQLLDKYGPKAGKLMLDAIGIIRDRPSIKTIRSLNLPPEVKKELEREFNIFMLSRERGERTLGKVAEDSKQDRKPASKEGFR